MSLMLFLAAKAMDDTVLGEPMTRGSVADSATEAGNMQATFVVYMSLVLVNNCRKLCRQINIIIKIPSINPEDHQNILISIYIIICIRGFPGGCIFTIESMGHRVAPIMSCSQTINAILRPP